MSIFKSKKLWISSGIIGTAIVAIGTGVGINASNYEKANTIDLVKLLDSITANSIVIRPVGYSNNNEAQEENELRRINFKNDLNTSSNEIDINSTYAFNLRVNQLELKEEVKLPKEVEVSFSFANANNKASNLNDGTINVEVSLTYKQNETQSKIIILEGFKKSNGSFSSILSTKQKDQLDFDIKPFEIKTNSTENGINGAGSSTSTNVNNYVSIEDLNRIVKVNRKDNKLITTNVFGSNDLKPTDKENEFDSDLEEISLLSYWLRKNSTLSTTKQNEVKDVTLLGNVKLKKIAKEDNQVYFYLTSSDENASLNLIRRDENGIITSQTSIDQIKTTNLLASDITIVPKDLDQEKQLNSLIN